MSTLATFGVSKDHARERAGLLSGGPAVGRLSGLGLARMPDGGTRKVCPGTVVQYPYSIAEGPGFINALFPYGTTQVDMVVHAGPDDLVVIAHGIVIGRVKGCGVGVFRVGSCVIQPLQGGNPIVITATEWQWAPGQLIRTFCVGFDQWGEYSTGIGSTTALIKTNAPECGWEPPQDTYRVAIEVTCSCGYVGTSTSSIGWTEALSTCPYASGSWFGGPWWGVKYHWLAPNRLVNGNCNLSIDFSQGITYGTGPISDDCCILFVGLKKTSTGEYIRKASTIWKCQNWWDRYVGGFANVVADPNTDTYSITPIMPLSRPY